MLPTFQMEQCALPQLVLGLVSKPFVQGRASLYITLTKLYRASAANIFKIQVAETPEHTVHKTSPPLPT